LQRKRKGRENILTTIKRAASTSNKMTASVKKTASFPIGASCQKRQKMR
jgi:hypothetical protein